MKFAPFHNFIIGFVALVIASLLFVLFSFMAKKYDEKHPNAPRKTGHYMTPKASFDMSKGDRIFLPIYFFIILPLIVIITVLILAE